MKVRVKQNITYQSTGEVVREGMYEVGDGITQEQFEAIEEKPKFCEVMEEPKEPAKPASKSSKAKVSVDVEAG